MNKIVFFDDKCNFCRRSIQILVKLDTKEQFVFAPLRGTTAEKMIDQSLLKENTLVFYENKDKIWIRARAIFRLLWLIGGPYRLIGFLYILPFGFDWIYRIVAICRNKCKPGKAVFLPKNKRFKS